MRRPLGAFVGRWSISYSYEPSERMPHGGAGRGTEVWWPGPGGNSLIEEYRSSDETGDFSGLALLWWDPEVRGYQVVWCQSRTGKGCALMAGPGTWEGGDFVLRDESTVAGKKTLLKEVFSDITPVSFTQTIYTGESDKELKPSMTIRATRLTEPAGH